MSIYVGKPVVVSDMQGPCGDGYHIPTKTEWETLHSVGQSVGAWTNSGGVDLSTYLKLPKANNLYKATGAYNSNSVGTYWTSINFSGYYGYYFGFTDASINTGYVDTNRGYSIRAFANVPVQPDNTRTVLYQGTGNAGVYHNSILGLISISSDGTTRYTIKDKNEGSTVVYNYGDAMSQSNCGNFFQQGNNYGFPYTGATTTSSTKVDASAYGPSNPYSSSTFIKGSYGWNNSTSTDNLWGGVSQGTSTVNKEVKHIYVGEKPVEPKWDYVSKTVTGQQTNTSYCYGVSFTAKKNCKLFKVKFLGDNGAFGWLAIYKGTYINYNAATKYWVTTSDTAGGLYTLETPYELEQGATYSIGFRTDGTYTYGYTSVSSFYPVDGENITYINGTYSATSSPYYNTVYCISGLATQ